MKTRAIIAALLVLLSLSAAAPAAETPPQDLKALLESVPADSILVVGIPNLKQAIADFRAWIDPIIAAQLTPEQLRKYDANLKTLAEFLPGPLVIDVSSLDEFPMVIAPFAGTQAEGMRRLQERGFKVEEHEGMLAWAVADADSPQIHAVVRNGRLVGTFNEDALRKYLATPPEKGKSVLSAPGMDKLLESKDVTSATMFLCCPQPNRLVDAIVKHIFPYASLENPRNRVPVAILRRSLAAFGIDPVKPTPAALCLKVTDKEIRLSGFLLMAAQAKVEPKPAPDLTRLPLGLLEAPTHAYGWKLPTFAAFVDDIAGGMDRFDPDVGAEFREKMGELDRDLGYNFQKDFLGLLGPEWMCVPGIAEEMPLDVAVVNPAVSQVFICSLKNPEAFLVRAARLCAITDTPWERVEDIAGAPHFKTEILLHPVELVVRENALLISPSAGLLERLQKSDVWTRKVEAAKLAAIMRDSSASSRGVTTVNAAVPALFPALKAQVPELAQIFMALPASMRLTFETERLADRFRFELALTGLTPKDVHALLAANSPALAGAREKARRTACFRNLIQIMSALNTYQSENKGAMPAKLTDLMPKYVEGNTIFACPSAEAADKPAPHYGYVFIPAEDAAAMDAGTAVVIYDNEGNHEGGRNVMFLDCHIEWLTEPRFQAALKKTLDGLAKAKAAREAKPPK